MKVDVAVMFLPHYRSSLIGSLEKDERVRFRWLVGDQLASSMPTVDLKHLQYARLDNRRLPFGLFWQGNLIRDIRRSKPDVLLLTGDPKYFSTWILLPICRVMGIKTLLWTHGWTRPDHGLKRLIRRAFYRLADGLVLYGQRAYQLGLDHSYRKPMHVIYNSTDVEIADAPSINEFGDGTQSWCVVSRLTPEKGFDRVLDAVKFLGDRGKKVNLKVVGDGPEMEKLRERARLLGIEVDFMGSVYDKAQVNSVIDSSDILVSPMNVGLSAMQAMARGCPVGTSSIDSEQMPEAEAVRDGVTGVRFNPYSVESLANSVWDFVENSDLETVGYECLAEIRTCWNADVQSGRLVDALLSVGVH